MSTKRTYQPKKKKRNKMCGFRHRAQTKKGQAVLKRRRNKGRKKLTTA
ncbi:MAG: 50S ribosomal protein L34 [Candidatus Moranbacteria bacterium]|nr:50S ribosomal protein L34 [Candidatus Moranbacteria bacterium]